MPHQLIILHNTLTRKTSNSITTPSSYHYHLQMQVLFQNVLPQQHRNVQLACSKLYRISSLSSSSSSLSLLRFKERTPYDRCSASTGNVNLSKMAPILYHKEFIRCLYSPFIISLAAGDLHLKTFKHYLFQDVQLLQTCVDAYKFVEDFVDDQRVKSIMSVLRRNVMVELRLEQTFQNCGIDEDQQNSVSHATKRYIDFLLDAMDSKRPAYVVAALTPCVRLYAYLGKQLQRATLGGNNCYQNWIDMYSTDQVEVLALDIEEALDILCNYLEEEELVVINNLYQEAMKLEIEFFQSQPQLRNALPLLKEIQASRQNLVLGLDYNGTCTVTDSSLMLVDRIISQSPALLHTWNTLSWQYGQRYKACIGEMLSMKGGGKFDYENLGNAIKILDTFLRDANARVVHLGILKGIDYEEIQAAGHDIVLQVDCQNFLYNAAQIADVNIISCDWCGDQIRSSLASGNLNQISVHTNEFTYQGMISTNEINMKVQTSMDKLQIFEKLGNFNDFTVYIGDSVGDLFCLLKADIGIVIGSNSTLRRIGENFGVIFRPLFQGVVMKQQKGEEISSWKAGGGVLYTVSSWAEIHVFILGY